MSFLSRRAGPDSRGFLVRGKEDGRRKDKRARNSDIFEKERKLEGPQFTFQRPKSMKVEIGGEREDRQKKSGDPSELSLQSEHRPAYQFQSNRSWQENNDWHEPNAFHPFRSRGETGDLVDPAEQKKRRKPDAANMATERYQTGISHGLALDFRISLSRN
ncbi:MAG: hypothetical protein AAFY84_01695 [Pseudomonadota bacterium]